MQLTTATKGKISRTEGRKKRSQKKLETTRKQRRCPRRPALIFRRLFMKARQIIKAVILLGRRCLWDYLGWCRVWTQGSITRWCAIRPLVECLRRQRLRPLRGWTSHLTRTWNPSSELSTKWIILRGCRITSGKQGLILLSRRRNSWRAASRNRVIIAKQLYKLISMLLSRLLNLWLTKSSQLFL